MIKFIRVNNFQITKFLLVGCLSALLNFVFYHFIYTLTLKINLASLIGYSLGLLNSFYFSTNWVFTKSEKFNLKRGLIIFILIYFIGGLEMTITINILNNIFQNYRFAWLVGALIAAINNYFGSKYLLFKN